MSILSQQKQSVNTDFPNLRPSLDLRFALAKKLDPRVTFSRGSTGTYFGPDGLMRTAGVNEPRFDHDPVTGQSLGLLIEESRQNYELNSSDPTTWTIVNMTLTGNSIVLPDGTTSTNVEFRGTDSGANSKLIRPLPSGSGVSAGETWTFSIFLRAGTEQTVQIAMQTQTGGDSITRNFNLVTGQWTGTLGGTNAANGRSGYQYFGNGWYRVWLINTYQGSSSGQQTIVRLRANTTQMQMTTSFSAWGAQLEKGSFPTSYIPTGASTVTRSVDVASMTGTNFSSWYNSSEGTLYANAVSNGTATQITGVAALNNSSAATTNRVDIRYHQSGNSLTVFNGINGGSTILSRTSGFSLTNPKFIVSYASQNINFAVNASLVSSITSRFIPSPLVNRLIIGSFDSGNNFYLNGTISRLTYYPIQLTNQQLINLSN